ncbi:unnamed protein product [Moneuplotes crassus]|uniref:Uncharacterized protein n=1 Tax=Euplotes crassus TaxID=5936 RepID=A0AAD1UEB0_EUPCR|nr:unnamed protein product [Moneuplotes crassus]
MESSIINRQSCNSYKTESGQTESKHCNSKEKMGTIVPTITIMNSSTKKRLKPSKKSINPNKIPKFKLSKPLRSTKKRPNLPQNTSKTEEVLKILPGILKKEFQAKYQNKNLLDFLCKTIIIQSGADKIQDGSKIDTTEEEFNTEKLIDPNNNISHFQYQNDKIKVDEEYTEDDTSKFSRTQGNWHCDDINSWMHSNKKKTKVSNSGKAKSFHPNRNNNGSMRIKPLKRIPSDLFKIKIEHLRHRKNKTCERLGLIPHHQEQTQAKKENLDLNCLTVVKAKRREALSNSRARSNTSSKPIRLKKDCVNIPIRSIGLELKTSNTKRSKSQKRKTILTTSSQCAGTIHYGSEGRSLDARPSTQFGAHIYRLSEFSKNMNQNMSLYKHSIINKDLLKQKNRLHLVSKKRSKRFQSCSQSREKVFRRRDYQQPSFSKYVELNQTS